VRHLDKGWDHFAGVWEVLAPDGDVIGVRVLDADEEADGDVDVEYRY